MAGKGYPGKRRSSCVPFTDLRANGCAASTERERRSVETSETRLRMSCWVRRGAGGGAAGGTDEDLGLLRSWGRRWGADMTGGRVRPASSKNRRFSSSALISALMCSFSRASLPHSPSSSHYCIYLPLDLPPIRALTIKEKARKLRGGRVRRSPW